MALSITHATVAVGTDAGNGEIHKAEWNQAHSISGTLSADDTVDGTTNKVFTATEKTKLSGIEALADVTDAANVDAAGAVMNSDTSTASMSFVDNGTVATNSTTKVPTQAAVKTYADTSYANAVARANHTGTQTASTISDFSTAADARIAADTNIARLNVQNQALTGGATVTSLALNGGSAVTSGTLTLDVGDCPLQHYTNGGAHTLAPGSVNGAAMIDITNNGSAGAITTSGFTKVVGDSFTTTNAHKFRCHVSVGNGGSLLIVQALQ